MPPSAVRILIVQALSVQPLAEVLEESGYELLRAGDAMAAVEGLAAQPRLILMDMELPDLPGDAPVELLRRLAASGIPVMTLSRRQDAQRSASLLAAGASDCLFKPVRLSELLAQVERRIHPAATSPALEPQRPVASMTVRERDGHCNWQTPQARALMLQYFPAPWADHARLPPEVLAWLHREALRRRAGAVPAGLTVAPRAGQLRQRLSFNLMPADPVVIGDGHWLMVLHEADEAALVARLAKSLGLPLADAELLYWTLGEPTPRQQVHQLGLSEAAYQAQMRGLCERLGVNDPAQAVVRARAVLARDA
ncbi:Response regulator receiver domain-containing protein [Roseateles sp. YR242]|uniref:response regulator n=1 Tax=Roseateles sp. YR242 TaxID=1855305 RepID=UPI0008D34CA3|nr:response regulator [Roseateles sp. YR242]SEK98165.1 Response regulator receiver domain-containing protein [Roseateles sp. YR242]